MIALQSSDIQREPFEIGRPPTNSLLRNPQLDTIKHLMKDLNILITGGLGYLGGRIADSLKKNFPETTITLGTRRKTRDIPNWAESFKIIHFDICDSTSIEKAVIGSDIVIHLAALNEYESINDIEAAWKTNALGTQALLSSADRKGVQRFVYFSTFHVYGDCRGTITENSPAQPHHPYAATHRAAEDMVRFYQYYKNMDTLIFRLSNGFGYPMDTGIDRWALVFNDLCRQTVTSGKMVLKSSGKQHRDFISLHNVSAAVEHFLFKIQGQWKDGLYNLGGDESLSIAEAAKTIARVYKKKHNKTIPIEINDKKENGPCDPVCFNIDKLKATGFQLTGDKEMEIEQTLSLCENFNT